MPSDGLLVVRDAIAYLLALVLSICVHEFGHAWVADRLGDPLPRSQGRVTLNPLAHIDPLGTILMPLLAFGMSVYSPALGSRILGWGRPVQVSGRGRAGIPWQRAQMLIALAGPAMNVLFALLLTGVFVLLARSGAASQLAVPIASVVLMNIGLACFNLIPCSPLDGGAVLRWILPRSLESVSEFLDQYGSFVLLALLMSGQLPRLMAPAYALGMWWMGVAVRLAG